MMSEQTNVNQEATATEAEAPEAVETEAVAKEETESAESSEDAETPADDVDGELKTVRKALDKRNRYINNQRNKIRALEAEINKLKDPSTFKKADAPQLEKFDSVIDYMDAKSNHNLDQRLAEQAHKAQLAALEQQQQVMFEQRTQEVATHVQELLSSNPEFAKVVRDNANVIEAMPSHVEKLMMEIDNAPAATYALAKEGRLQDLYYMPPELAAAHLVQAEIRGQQYLQQSSPKASAQAPKPIGSIKGGSGKSSSKSPEDMSPDQLMKWLKN